MALSWNEFSVRRQGHGAAQFFSNPDATRTVMVCSHIWWTEQIALAIYNAGFHVLMHFPLYLAYTDDAAFARLDELWNGVLGTLRQTKPDFILGGNSAAILAHPKTGEQVHEVAGIPLVNWWWDELRAKPPLARAFLPRDFLRLLASPRTLNAIWDLDVKEELETAQNGIILKNLIHLPLATLPDYWPHGYLPLEERPLACCFLGNCHFPADWVETDQDPLVQWARDIVGQKVAAPMRPMQDCIMEATTRAGGFPAADKSSHMSGGKDAWQDFYRPWEILNATYMHYTRNLFVQAAGAYLKGKLALIGKGWDKLTPPLRANMEHAGDKSGVIYGQSQISLNLFGGCVHGGMPLRPFDIGASGGLIATHQQRELPDLFEPGKECLAFQTRDDMLAIFERVRAAPSDFNAIALAGRKRVLAQHSWAHRVPRLMAAMAERFDVKIETA